MVNIVSGSPLEVILADLFKKEQNNYRRVDSFSLDNLFWSTPDVKGIPRVYCEYISPNTYKYCNLGHIHDPKYRGVLGGESNPKLHVKDDETLLSFDMCFKSNILYHLIPKGTYKFKLKIGCANAATITKEYELEFLGNWNENESLMLDNCVKIKEIR